MNTFVVFQLRGTTVFELLIATVSVTLVTIFEFHLVKLVELSTHLRLCGLLKHSKLVHTLKVEKAGFECPRFSSPLYLVLFITILPPKVYFHSLLQ